MGEFPLEGGRLPGLLHIHRGGLIPAVGDVTLVIDVVVVILLSDCFAVFFIVVVLGEFVLHLDAVRAVAISYPIHLAEDLLVFARIVTRHGLPQAVDVLIAVLVVFVQHDALGKGQGIPVAPGYGIFPFRHCDWS